MSSFTPAKRAGVGLLIGIAGETGSGKTLSALRVGRGLAGGDDSRMAFIDTEAGRALHYAAAEGQALDWKTFGFMHADMQPPFTPERYLEKIQEADRAGFAVIVIDSFSHEWDGEGGCSDIHDADLDEMVENSRRKNGSQSWWDEATQREKLSITAWKGAKLRHKRMVSRLLQCRAHLVICMRAEDKLRIEQKKDRETDRFAKTVITPAAQLPPRERWQPICEKRFPFQLITSLVVTPDNPGVPIAIKLQEQHRAFIREDRPLDEAAGEGLAAWARGSVLVVNTKAIDDDEDVPRIAFDGEEYAADKPVILPFSEQPGEDEMRAFGKALRALFVAAPEADHQEQWATKNADALLRIKAVSIKLYTWIREPFPEIAAGPNQAALGATSDGAGGPLIDPAGVAPNFSSGGF